MDSNEYKLGTEFRLSIGTDYETRTKALDLDVGYDPYQLNWELVVLYVGDLEKVANELHFRYIKLLNNYAIIYIHESKIKKLSAYAEILYIDKPKQIYLEQTGCEQSCMRFETIDSLGNISYLTGKGVLVAVLDSGIDFGNSNFIKEDGTSKVLYFWDQSMDGNAPEPYAFGTEYNQTEINNFDNKTFDFSGHGTAVASIVSSCAREASFLIVKLKQGDNITQSKTTALICAIDYSINKAKQLGMPLVINISYGNDYGDHAGNTILESYIDSVSTYYRLNTVVGTGNEGNTRRHARLKTEGFNRYESRFRIDAYETAINLQIWYSFLDNLTISIVTPDGIILGPFSKYQPIAEYVLNEIKVLAIAGLPSQINQKQELYIAIVPKNTYITAGVYTVIVQTEAMLDGIIDLWLPASNSTNTNVSFLDSDPEVTLTIPSSAQNAISVGAYDIRTERYANFSGRGFDAAGRIKPDICAPGVLVKIVEADGTIRYVTGTSFATPYVSAGVALLMQWGIIEQNDLFMYGQKLKFYLLKGARPLIGDIKLPNEKTGYGALCIENSLNI